MRICLMLALLVPGMHIIAQETTVYLIRHAEKVKTDNPDPELTEKGTQRALQWAQVFRNIELDAVYSTGYIRTIKTAMPTAESNDLEIQQYNPMLLNHEDFIEANKGNKVLMVGHSNTIPVIVNRIIGKEKYEHIESDNNCNLYIIQIADNVITDMLLYIE